MVLDVAADLDAGYRSSDLFQALSSLHNRLASEVSAIRPKQIEQEINNRSSRTLLPFLKQLESGDPFVIQSHDFTVQNGRAQFQLIDCLSDGWELGFEW